MSSVSGSLMSVVSFTTVSYGPIWSQRSRTSCLYLLVSCTRFMLPLCKVDHACAKSTTIAPSLPRLCQVGHDCTRLALTMPGRPYYARLVVTIEPGEEGGGFAVRGVRHEPTGFAATATATATAAGVPASVI
ncbi:hypothetical protein B296_00028339 [Ensete ventricosum]|uniref:Uncharacterized protein n=1 Tax=Ensete ventricosum TaxID=4639 RepID=A0A426YVU5_ENSVE|nr:hypothetical protein B296_00028339 [Ensete ventricosum]